MAIIKTTAVIPFFLLTSLLTSLILTKVILHFSTRFNILDIPNSRKLHNLATPTLGGIAIFASFFISFLGIGFYANVFSNTFASKLHGLILGALILLSLGLFDDIKGTSSTIKIAIQLVAILYVIKSGIYIDRITNPFGDKIMIPKLGQFLTVLWMLLLINAVNLIDGMDGLAAGICSIAMISITLICIIKKELLIAYMAATLIGSTLGFLKYNFYPAKIFMGDTGSLFLGYIISIMAIITNGRKASIAITLLIPIIIMGIPLIDTTLSFFRRLAKRTYPFTPDKGHIHHRLLSLGLPYKQVLYIFYLLSAYLGVSALILSLMPKQVVFWIFVILLLGGITIWILFRIVENHVTTILKRVSNNKQKQT